MEHGNSEIEFHKRFLLVIDFKTKRSIHIHLLIDPIFQMFVNFLLDICLTFRMISSIFKSYIVRDKYRQKSQWVASRIGQKPAALQRSIPCR